MGGENVGEGEKDPVKRQNERQIKKLKILFLGFPAYTQEKIGTFSNDSFHSDSDVGRRNY